jgi:hypothetical protein
LNPLPFSDLEPHRFEDLVRQLAYDLRCWKSLEAIGRGGADGGVDIRATELVPVDQEPTEDEVEKDEKSAHDFIERQWIFQCKREKALAPKRIRTIVEESLAASQTPPYGFVLAAACDISKLARDAFREEMVSRRIEEFFIWAKSELEDLLFQPRNDRLLFAYFGIALQPRRRNLASALRSEITKKKQLTALIGEEDQRNGKLILLRDPTDERYPHDPKEKEPRARWLLCRALSLQTPGRLIVLRHEYLAAITADGKRWDAIFDRDTMMHMAEGELMSAHAWSVDEMNRSDRSAHVFWNEYIDESQRAILKIRRAVPLDRILALDPLGDGYFPVPHILVEFFDKTGPFVGGQYSILERGYPSSGHIDIDLGPENREHIFPKLLPVPDENEPAGFDDTGNGIPLASKTKETLEALLAKVGECKKTAETREMTEADPFRDGDRNSATIRDFQQWREKVAVPVFSSFVHRLRVSGHRARVVIASVAPGSPEENRSPFERVELKMRLHAANYFTPSGHVRISCSQHTTTWQTNIAPTAKDPRGLHRTSEVGPSIDATSTKERLESLVLTVLQRMEGELG